LMHGGLGPALEGDVPGGKPVNAPRFPPCAGYLTHPSNPSVRMRTC
jgi:hypothetical protein